MKAWVCAVAAVFGLAGDISAQVPPQNVDSEQVRKARQQISMMEGVLERAVQNGVDNLRRKVRAVMPDDALIQGGLPQVRGFRLEGYGVFFDVEVPGLRPSMAWTLRTLNDTGLSLARDLARMRAYVQSLPDARMRADLDRTLQRIQRGIGPVPPVGAERAASQPGAATAVAAQSVDPAGSAPPAPVAMPATAPAVPPAPAIDPALLADPNDAYTEEVKAALVDAMLDYSGALVIGAEEWLTVAAKGNEPGDPFTQGNPDARTILLRIKGSELGAFRSGRAAREEVRKRVEIREF